MSNLQVGATLYGYCEGVWGDDFSNKIIVAVGAGWLVAKSCTSQLFYLAQGDALTVLERHIDPDEDEYDA